MNKVQETIQAYLEALGRVYGPAYQKQTKVEYRGGSSVVLKLPNKPEQLISVGRLQTLTQYLKQEAQRKKAA